MNKHQFRTYCERILVPQIEAAMENHFRDIADVLDIVARELARMSQAERRDRKGRDRRRKS